MAIVCLVFGDAVGCGGRLMTADCGQGRQYCADTNVCCPDFTTCGNGSNGCPPGDCCLNTTSHIVDGGSESSSTGTELPPPEPGGGGAPDPSPVSPGGGGAGAHSGDKRS